MDDQLKDQPAPTVMVPVTPLDTETEAPPQPPAETDVTINTDGGDADVTVEQPTPETGRPRSPPTGHGREWVAASRTGCARTLQVRNAMMFGR
jgi:hypothetical protein